MSIGYDEIGGGVAGIVVKSNWTVFQTEPSAGQPVNGNVQLIVEHFSCSQPSAPSSSTPSSSATSVTFEGHGPMNAEQYLDAGTYRTSMDSCAQSVQGNDLQNAADNQYGTFIRLADGGTATIRFTGNYVLYVDAACDWHVTFTPK